MKCKLLSGFLALLLLFSLLPVLPVGAERSDTDIPYAVEGGNIYFDKGTGTITGCDETVTSANIPAEIDGVAVTAIGDSAFSNCTGLTSVTIPGSVTTIGRGAFSSCASLTAVTIPDSVTTIGDVAFSWCSNLTAVTIPDSVTTIGDDAFYGRSNLKSIEVSSKNPNYSSKDGVLFDKTQTILYRHPSGKAGAYEIPGSVTTIRDNAFFACDALTAVTIPDSVTMIGDSVFYECNGLTEVTIPSSVTTVGDNAFYGCDALAAVTIPNSVTTIGERAFYVCTSLTAVTIPDSVTTIGGAAFCGCTSLTSVTIPNSVTTIGDAAFNGCTSLTSVTIPNSVTTIGDNAFWDCTSLTSVTIPNSVTAIGDNAFFNCTSLTAVTLPNSVTTIGGWAFFESGLTSVTLPSSVTTIGDLAFANCTSLTAVYFGGDAPELGRSVFQTGGYDDWSNIPGLTLYYIEGKAGWTSPTWNGYPTATWDGKTDDPTPDDPSTPTFTDVPANAWFAGAVDYAVENELMNGMGNNEFQPNTSMTRAMLVTVLWRYADSPKQGENTFTDVPSGKYYTEAVAWAAANGIVNGVGDGKFNPDGNITREQMVTILYRYCKQLNIDTSKADDLTGFPDVGNVGNSAKDAMCWAVAEKLIGGKSLDASGTVYLQPKGSATRAEVATILMRFIENILKK